MSRMHSDQSRSSGDANLLLPDLPNSLARDFSKVRVRKIVEWPPAPQAWWGHAVMARRKISSVSAAQRHPLLSLGASPLPGPLLFHLITSITSLHITARAHLTPHHCTIISVPQPSSQPSPSLPIPPPQTPQVKWISQKDFIQCLDRQEALQLLDAIRPRL
jgi:hypothetical protein